MKKQSREIREAIDAAIALETSHAMNGIPLPDYAKKGIERLWKSIEEESDSLLGRKDDFQRVHAMRNAGDYYDEKAIEALKLNEELADKLNQVVALQNEIQAIKRRLEQARYVGD